MTLTLDLPADIVERLQRGAAEAGVPVEKYAQRVLDSGIPLAVPGAAPNATLSLLADWARQDATNDPNELAARQRDLDDLATSLNRNRLQSGGPGIISMSRTIFLDSGPLGLVTHRAGVAQADACREWLASRIAAGDEVVVAEIIYY